MEPTDALRSIETALRLAIVDVLGEQSWLDAPGAPDRTKLLERREEESKRRDGAKVSQLLLDYAETYHLTGVVKQNWDKFAPVFSDRERTRALLGIVEDVRNSVAHSRDLIPFERDLVSGIAGMMRNQVSLYRSSRITSARYYPLIESIKDHFGDEGHPEHGPVPPGQRIEVGSVISFTGSAFNAKGRPVRWQILPVKDQIFMPSDHSKIEAAIGDSVHFEYEVTENDVHELFALNVRITAESRWHRNMPGHREPYDDQRIFLYSVNPPDED